MITLKVIIEAIERICKELQIDQQVRPGPKAKYKDSYFITLIILKPLFGFSSELSYLRFLKKHSLPGLKNVPDQSWYNRKTKKLLKQVEQVRILLLEKLGVEDIRVRIVDSVPVPVITYARSGRCKSFQQGKDAGFGYCAATKTKYFGQKLTLLTTPEGIPTDYYRALANKHDLRIFKDMLEERSFTDLNFVGDKGFIMKPEDQEKLLAVNNCDLTTPFRKNQKKRLTKRQRKLLSNRKIIETINSQLSDQMELKRTRAKSDTGLQARIAGMMLAMTFGIYFNQLFDRNILALKSILT